jgi:hypothetical protein
MLVNMSKKSRIHAANHGFSLSINVSGALATSASTYFSGRHVGMLDLAMVPSWMSRTLVAERSARYSGLYGDRACKSAPLHVCIEFWVGVEMSESSIMTRA